jgi:hypothetical protein
MRNRNAAENDPVFIEKRSFSASKIFNLMQRKPGVPDWKRVAVRPAPAGVPERA